MPVTATRCLLVAQDRPVWGDDPWLLEDLRIGMPEGAVSPPERMASVRIRRAANSRLPVMTLVTFMLCAFLVAVSLTACGEAPDWCASSVPTARVVANDGEGSWARSGVAPALTEVWRVGGLEDDQALAEPMEPAVSSEGWVAIPDAALSELILVGPSGEWRGSALREGEGPGEVRWPVAAGWADANTLLVLDLSAAKVIEFDVASDSLVTEWKLPQEVFAKIGLSGYLPGIRSARGRAV